MQKFSGEQGLNRKNLSHRIVDLAGSNISKNYIMIFFLKRLYFFILGLACLYTIYYYLPLAVGFEMIFNIINKLKYENIVDFLVAS